MTKRFWCVFCLLLLCVSCATGQHQPVSDTEAEHKEIVLPREEPHGETVDKSCAYFYYLWGKSAEYDHHYEEALEAYDKALVCDPGAEHVMRTLASLLINLGRNQEAIGLIEEIIALNPTDLYAKIYLADLYVKIGEEDRAMEMYQNILVEDPENLRVMQTLGLLYARKREYGKARDILEKLVALNSQSYHGYYYLANLYRELRFFDKAAAAYQKALSLNWSAHLALELGELYMEQQQYDKAIDLFRSVLEADETNEKAKKHLASIYLRQGKIDQAIKELEELRDIAPDASKIDFAIGQILFDHKRYDEAVTLFERLARKHPESESVRAMLILTYYKKGDLAAAKKYSRLVKPEDKGYEDAVLMLASILKDEGDLEGAARLLKENIAVAATRRPGFYAALADIFQAQNNVEQARRTFDQALAEYPDEVRLLFQYSLFLDSIGDTDAALSRMEEVLALDPDNPFALNYVGYTWAENDINLEEALSYIEKAVSLKPNDGFVRDSLGWVYFKLGNVERAISELKTAVEMTPDDPTIYEHLGDALAKGGQVDSALAAYKKAYDLYKEEEKKEQVRRKIEALQ